MKKIKFRTAFYNFNDEFSHFRYWGTIDHLNEFSESSFTSPASNNTCVKKDHDQYIGSFIDENRNNIEVYENDYVEIFRFDELDTSVVFVKDIRSIPCAMYGTSVKYLNVIGNVHETPNLLDNILKN